MIIEKNKQVVKDFFEVGDRGDVPRCLELLDDGLHWSNHRNTRFSGPVVGKQALGDGLMGPLFRSLKQGLHTGIQRLIAEGETVVIEVSGPASTGS